MSWNSWALAVLAALVAAYLVDLIADVLHWRSTRDRPPPRLANLYDTGDYQKSQAHARASTLAGIVRGTVELAAVLGFWFAGGFGWLDQLVAAWGLPMPWDGLLFLGLMVVGQLALSLPFSIWDTFWLEAQFGFNRTSVRTFVLDGLKTLVLMALLGAPFAALVLIFFTRAGSHGWWMAWLVASVASVIMQRLMPRFVLPLFLRFEPLPDGSLRQAIERWARQVGLRLDGLFVVDGSRRSSRANAFVSGSGRSARIALFDTLVDRMPEDETVAVLAHEVGHDRLGHITKGTVLAIVHLGAMFFLLGVVLAQAGLYQAFGTAPSAHAGLVFFALLARPAELILGAASGALSRRFEFEADRYAAESAGAAPMIRALESLGRDNLVNLTPHPFRVALYDSHPPLAERIAALDRSIQSEIPIR